MSRQDGAREAQAAVLPSLPIQAFLFQLLSYAAQSPVGERVSGRQGC